MKSVSILDVRLLSELFCIIEGFRSRPGERVTGAAIAGLRLLFSLTEQWRDFLAENLAADEALDLPEHAGEIPLTAAAAAALHRSVSQSVLEILELRTRQRGEVRGEDGRVFTAVDYDAARLRRRVGEELGALPTELPKRKVGAGGERGEVSGALSVRAATRHRGADLQPVATLSESAGGLVPTELSESVVRQATG